MPRTSRGNPGFADFILATERRVIYRGLIDRAGTNRLLQPRMSSDDVHTSQIRPVTGSRIRGYSRDIPECRSSSLEAAMRKFATLAILSVFLFSAGALLAQNASSDSCSNPDAVAKMVNPVKPTAESLAQGKKYYGYDCAMCHGATGDGKGEVDTGQKLPDFTNPATFRDRTDGQLFCSLKFGKAHMPVEPARTSENDLWSLVNYV